MMARHPLRIVHIARTPVGGVFRHILDLSRGQAARGHHVGLVCDSATGGERADSALAEIAPQLALGISRIPIPREIGPGDALALVRATHCIAPLGANVLHGHGAKGGALARLVSAPCAVRVYTPHGGSLHYGRYTVGGMLYGALERILMRRTNLLLFESEFAQHAYRSMVGAPRCIVRVVHNGITAAEMSAVTPCEGAADIICIGELRRIKGMDVLLDAVAELHRCGRPVTLAVAGEGPDEGSFRVQATRLGLGDSVRFLGHVPARQAFALGRLLVVPSRAESLPYVVLEAGAAGIPIVATRVGGIPEVLGSDADLVAPENPTQLAKAIAAALDDPARARAAAARVRERIGRLFSHDAMVDGILSAYGEVLRTRVMQSQ